ncbi:hypothetical protein CBL_01708 [Carabus blaptoides fortunei]
MTSPINSWQIRPWSDRCTSTAAPPLDDHVGEHTIRSKFRPLGTWRDGISETVKHFYVYSRSVTAPVDKQKDALQALCDEQYVPLSDHPTESNKECCMERVGPAPTKSACQHSTNERPFNCLRRQQWRATERRLTERLIVFYLSCQQYVSTTN